MMRSSRVLALTSELQFLPAQGPRITRRCLSWGSSSPRAPRSPIASSSSSSSSSLPSAAFFLSNRSFERSSCLHSVVSKDNRAATSASSTEIPPPPPRLSASITQSHQTISELPPHRQRQARKKTSTGASSTDAPLPPDASSVLTSAAAAQPKHSLRRSISVLLSLSKPRLTVLVVLSAMAPYALYPVPEILMPTMTETPSLSPLTLLFLTTGTALCSASANALNMLYEPSTDAKMSRTRNRPLVRGLISNRAAALFAILAGATGVGALYFGVNPTVSFLGLANIVLYAGIYTPLKAVTAFNTWVGAVVGGIPPLMGWAAAAGEAATKDGSWRELLLASDGSSVGGWLLAGLLFAWQFPHFMALSWPIRQEYKAAGLRMLAWTNPARNARVALRYSVAFIPLCAALCAVGVTDWSFAVTSLPINLWLLREAVRFWKYEGHKGSARGLFWASVWHLPGVMILALLHKKGMWSRAWESVFGEHHHHNHHHNDDDDDDDDGEWEEAAELEEMASMTAATGVGEAEARRSKR